MKKTSLIASVIALILSACASTAPVPPVIPYCPIVAVEGGDAYLYCQNSDGTGSKWRVKIKDLPQRPEKYVCTTDEGYAAGYKYGQDLKRWVQNNCNK